MTLKTLEQRLEEIKLLMQYAVPEADREEALALVEKYATDGLALNIFRSFYSYLPEGRDDTVKILRLLARKEGAFLICATTALADYLYLANSEQAEFIGPLAEGIWDSDILAFFGFRNCDAFLKTYRDLSAFPVYAPVYLDNNLCPVCHAAEGEYHTLGCPVEICPWCGGQLTNCPCRFNKLGVHEMSKEAQINALLERLDEKGRLPFDAAGQNPSYPLTPEDLKGE